MFLDLQFVFLAFYHSNDRFLADFEDFQRNRYYSKGNFSKNDPGGRPNFLHVLRPPDNESAMFIHKLWTLIFLPLEICFQKKNFKIALNKPTFFQYLNAREGKYELTIPNLEIRSPVTLLAAEIYLLFFKTMTPRN